MLRKISRYLMVGTALCFLFLTLPLNAMPNGHPIPWREIGPGGGDAEGPCQTCLQSYVDWVEEWCGCSSASCVSTNECMECSTSTWMPDCGGGNCAWLYRSTDNCGEGD